MCLRTFCGVDEAGRGPVLGPMVVGAVFVEDESPLRDLGVKDSKKLTPKKRDQLYDEITSSYTWAVSVCPAESIDEQRKTISLNEIELNMFAEVAGKTPCFRLIADCPDINEKSFGERLGNLIGPDVEIIAKHKADDTYPVVSAASIVAKVTRDRLLDEIRSEFDVNIGSGYPSDHYTMDFIRNYIEENGRAPNHVRCSWEPVRQMLSKRANTKISDW